MTDAPTPPVLDETASPPDTAGPAGGPLTTVWQAFLDPLAAFRSLAVRPQWFWALVVIVLVSLTTQLVVASRMDLESTIRQGIAERQRDGQELNDAQVEQAVKAARAVSRVAMMSAPVAVPLVFALLAGIYLGMLRLVGSDIGFPSTFATVLHAALPPAVVGSALTVVVVLQREVLRISEMRGLVKSSLAAVLPEGTAKPLTALASVVDLFNIWQWILLILGLSIVGRVRRGQAVAVVAVAWGGWALVRAGLALVR